MRPVVSYEDITLPYETTSNAVEEAAKIPSTSNGTNPKSSSKKRKRKSRHSTNNQLHTGNVVASQADDEEEDYLEVEQSRELTQAEIWDDSALIDAWNAATEEYKAYHGPDKGWKNEPVHKSPLWYNTPPAKKQKHSQLEPASTAHSLVDGVDLSTAGATVPASDPQPIDFNTFVPTHDAGLSLPAFEQPGEAPGLSDYTAHYAALPQLPRPMVSQDEAFNRALGAMYWGGYWTAVYHLKDQRLVEAKGTEAEGKEEESAEQETEAGASEVKYHPELDIEGMDDDDEDVEYEEGDEVGQMDEADSTARGDFVSTQR